ncbi:MAG: 3-isopropylmalate dehydratase large subunit [Proteobacteria bacterium]|nr:3-isopropylmalate dehydratase large subunit [Pseudomonadota bacterium]
MGAARTLFDKVWDAHVVAEEQGCPTILYIDLHLVHEVTSPQAFARLRERGIGVRRPGRTLATMDHSTPTRAGGMSLLDAPAKAQLSELVRNCAQFGVTLHPVGSEGNGIVHVIAPEEGRTQPGMTVVCGDSHTATHGAFGSLAFGIGTTEVQHVLATQCLLQQRPKTYAVDFRGRPPRGVTAKDLILALIRKLGVAGGTGHVFEYRGDAVKALDMEARMTLCNMSIECGARAGMIAPDDTTFEYLAGRPSAPQGQAFERAVSRWRGLESDRGALFDSHADLDASNLAPMISWGTHPGQCIPIDAAVPAPEDAGDARTRASCEHALRYMDLEPGKPLLGQPVDVVFLGSCTNARLTDLRMAASILRGRKVADGVRVLVVPGSQRVKRAAESEGLDTVFEASGAQWRQPGCSMCIAMNGDQLEPGQYAVSTSNRNFEGRQGPGGRTFLASPLTAAACAVTGTVTDVRRLAPDPLPLEPEL